MVVGLIHHDVTIGLFFAGSSAMPDRVLWGLMQRVETLRYRAERLESAAAGWPSPWSNIAFDLAALLRRRADREYASGPSRTA